MTFVRLEIHRFICDKCGVKKQQVIAIEEYNVLKAEKFFIEDLKKKGWVYDPEEDMHYCKKCAS